jgi:Xaa-Pro aminopeptidase
MTTTEAPARPPQELVDARLAKVRAALAERDVPAVLVTGFENKGWVAAFTTGVFIAPGGAIIITPTQATFVTSHVDYEECLHGVPHMTTVPYDHFSEELHDRVAAVAAQHGIKRILVEAPHITVAEADKYAERFAKHDIELERGAPIVTPLRQVKDAWEIEQIKHAHAVVARAFDETLALLKPGVTEWEIAAELEYRLRKYSTGSSRLAFQSIVASGPNSALPHASVSQRRMQAGDFVKFDFGATWNGYVSDCTRTVVLGQASERQRAMYDAVLTAQLAAIDRLAAGVPAADVDKVAADSMTKAGFGDYIAHGLGHGIGVQVHEDPRLGSQSKDVLAPGHIVTIEPGLYVAGWGGVRIEDNILITEDGIENLTTVPKELLEL